MPNTPRGQGTADDRNRSLGGNQSGNPNGHKLGGNARSGRSQGDSNRRER